MNEKPFDDDATRDLLAACRVGDPESVKSAIARNADVNVTDSSRRGPMHIVLDARYDLPLTSDLIISRKKQIWDTLLSAGANLRVRDIDGRTLIHRAVIYGHSADLVRALVTSLCSEYCERETRMGRVFAGERTFVHMCNLLLATDHYGRNARDFIVMLAGKKRIGETPLANALEAYLFRWGASWYWEGAQEEMLQRKQSIECEVRLKAVLRERQRLLAISPEVNLSPTRRTRGGL